MGVRIVRGEQDPPEPHRCDLPQDHVRYTYGTVVECDECQRQYKLTFGDYGPSWSRVFFRRRPQHVENSEEFEA